MAPGVSKTKWHGNGSSFHPETPVHITRRNSVLWKAKRDEAEILSTAPQRSTRPILGVMSRHVIDPVLR